MARIGSGDEDAPVGGDGDRLHLVGSPIAGKGGRLRPTARSGRCRRSRRRRRRPSAVSDARDEVGIAGGEVDAIDIALAGVGIGSGARVDSRLTLRMPPRSPIAPRKAPLTDGVRKSGTVSSSPLSRKVQVTPWPEDPVAEGDWSRPVAGAGSVHGMAGIEGISATASTQLVAPVPRPATAGKPVLGAVGIL